MSESTSDLQHIHELLTGFSTAMLVTHAGGDRLRARPMALADVSETCRMFFLSSRECGKIHEIENDKRVHIVCQKDYGAYLSIDGRARMIDDHAEVARVWKESYRTWFPGGKTDPEIVLIVVEPFEAEYWDNTGANKARYLWEATRAYVTGEKPRISENQHGVVSL